MRIAYVTGESCGAGHAVRGVALVRAAGRAGVELRAFGPSVPYPALAAAGYEGSIDWEARAAAFAPELLVGDTHWILLEALRGRLGVPAWLLVKWMPSTFLRDGRIQAWDRRISIEPTSAALPGITDSIPPIVVADPADVAPSAYDGQDVTLGTLQDPAAPFPIAPLLTRSRSVVAPASYNTYWEAARLGYRDRVRWVDDGLPDRAARVRRGGSMTTNGADALLSSLMRS